MEVNKTNWNLAELVSEISVFKRDQKQLNIIIGFRVRILFVQPRPKDFRGAI